VKLHFEVDSFETILHAQPCTVQWTWTLQCICVYNIYSVLFSVTRNVKYNNQHKHSNSNQQHTRICFIACVCVFSWISNKLAGCMDIQSLMGNIYEQLRLQSKIERASSSSSFSVHYWGPRFHFILESSLVQNTIM